MTWTIEDEGVYTNGRYTVRERMGAEPRIWLVFHDAKFVFSSESATTVINYVDAHMKRAGEAS